MSLTPEMRKSQVSISSTFLEQLLHAQIPKAQKNTVKSSVISILWRFWDLRMTVKAVCKTLMKFTPAHYFIETNKQRYSIEQGWPTGQTFFVPGSYLNNIFECGPHFLRRYC